MNRDIYSPPTIAQARENSWYKCWEADGVTITLGITKPVFDSDRGLYVTVKNRERINETNFRPEMYKLHRTDGGPTLLDYDVRSWSDIERAFAADHPDDIKAIFGEPNSRTWHQWGKRHRLDGPAIARHTPLESYMWYIDDIPLCLNNQAWNFRSIEELPPEIIVQTAIEQPSLREACFLIGREKGIFKDALLTLIESEFV